ncbi:MAG: hypothetical protein GON13_00515 [Nanoarchaeota archaeon]|nr:hypothetical protein [Nanoarchaeota archaeon]
MEFGFIEDDKNTGLNDSNISQYAKLSREQTDLLKELFGIDLYKELGKSRTGLIRKYKFYDGKIKSIPEIKLIDYNGKTIFTTKSTEKNGKTWINIAGYVKETYLGKSLEDTLFLLEEIPNRDLREIVPLVKLKPKEKPIALYKYLKLLKRATDEDLENRLFKEDSGLFIYPI